MWRPSLLFHSSSVSLGAFGKEPHPMLFGIQPHFFVHRLDDSSKETTIWLQGKTHLQKTSLATCSNFSVVIQMQNIHSGFLFWPYFFWLCLLHLYYLPYKLCEQLSPPGVLAKEFIRSHAFFKLFFQFFLGMPYCLIYQVLIFSVFFAWTQPQLSEDFLCSRNYPFSASSHGRFLLDFLMSLLTVSMFRTSCMMPSNCTHAIRKNINWGLFLTTSHVKLFSFIKLSTTVAYVHTHIYLSLVISVSNFSGFSYGSTLAFFCICFYTYLVEFLLLFRNRELSFYFFWIPARNNICHWCHYIYMKIDGFVLRRYVVSRCAIQGRKSAFRSYTMFLVDCTSTIEKPLEVETLQSSICIREYYGDSKNNAFRPIA